MTRATTRRERRWRVTLGAVLATTSFAGCASPGVPPGGPPDDNPPRLIVVAPDSDAVNARPRDIEMLFDEVVSEVPSGVSGVISGGGGSSSGSYGGSGSFAGGGMPSGPSLASIVLVSPRTGALSVDWHRERVTIHQRGGFRPNTTYTVTLLPGLADLRGNVRDTAIVTTFSTGPRIDRGRLGGIIFDWVAGKPAARAIVEAIARDSTTWVTVADSIGRFVLPNLPAGVFLVRGTIDANNNRAFDTREAFDTVRSTELMLSRGDSAGIELLAFVHDTLGPRVTTVAVRDSMTLRLTFDRPLDPQQPITIDRFRVVARDSTVVAVREAYSGVVYDSVQSRRLRAVADSTARAEAAKDTTRRAPTPPRPPVDTAAARRDSTRGGRRVIPPPVPSKASPPTEVALVLAQPLKPSTFYRVTVIGQRSVSGRTSASSDRTFSTPKPEPPKPPADTTRRAPGDTTRRTPPNGPPGAPGAPRPATGTTTAPADTTRRRPHR